jgi:hypothetical protein
MDIVNVLNTIRLFKSFFTVMLPTQQRLLLQVQRNQVISSATEDNHDDIWDGDQEHLFRIFRKKDPIGGVIGLSYFSRSFKQYWH